LTIAFADSNILMKRKRYNCKRLSDAGTRRDLAGVIAERYLRGDWMRGDPKAIDLRQVRSFGQLTILDRSDPTSDAGVVSPVQIGLEPPDLLADIGGAAQTKAGTDRASQSGWSFSTRFAVKRAAIEFWSVLF
jgi:hypothetical protein